jgi:DNA/RNA endonuclease YhcR with UshA esterase domain
MITVLGLSIPDGLSAHHSTAAYDLIHGTIITGVVTRVEMLNPHGIIALDVAGEDEAVEHWTVAIDNPLALRRLGWSKNTLKDGDKITVTGNRAKNGSFHLRAVEVQLPDGKKLQAL